MTVRQTARTVAVSIALALSAAQGVPAQAETSAAELADAALVLENETGYRTCSGNDYAGTEANGAGVMYVKAPGAAQYAPMPYTPGFRKYRVTVGSEGYWGASAEVLLESVTYAYCVDVPPIEA